MEYKKVELKDRDIINKYFKGTPQWLAEYTFSTILSWACGGYGYEYKVEDEALFIAVVKESTGDTAYLNPISLKETFTPQKLYSLAKKEKMRVVTCVDGHYYNSFSAEEWDRYFSVSEDKGWGNYYFSLQSLADLKGSIYSAKRNLITQFMREYGNGKIEVKECSAPVIEKCIHFNEEWYKIKGDYNNCTLARELTALKLSLENFDYLGLSGMGLFIDGELRAFSIFERLYDETVVVHFEKTAKGYKGLPQYFLNQIALKLKQNYKYMNREGDMNDKGLKKAKSSLHPVFIEKSLRLEVK